MRIQRLVEHCFGLQKQKAASKSTSSDWMQSTLRAKRYYNPLQRCITSVWSATLPPPKETRSRMAIRLSAFVEMSSPPSRVALFSSCSAKRTEADQCFFFSRNIGEVTLKIIYFHYLKKCFLDQSIQKIFYLILKTEALLGGSVGQPCLWRWSCGNFLRCNETLECNWRFSPHKTRSIKSTQMQCFLFQK